ncbi:SLBB domain-containing protein [Butyricimonas sp. Marseille-P3923]|uniref:SLBB domain-containing protein n=1 Tax=Butyricimonas sp. Marseille-P3923 TaxID=1987504 RepID=UPI000C080751|nr:SLBB domain-containing protein [Butyricimonas sp. Marseille-P3923]
MRFLILIVLILGVSRFAFAQMSDTQVVEAVKEAQAQGKSQNEIILMLTQKGVTMEQIQRIQKSYGSQTGTQQGQADNSRGRTMAPLQVTKDTVVIRPRSKNDVFGREIFNNGRLTFEPNLSIPTPENYKLAPGDEVIIDIWGNSETTLREEISPDGSINVQGLGPVYLSGKQVKEASAYLKNVFSRIYSDLSSENPGTFIQLTLGKIRSIQVNVMGEVVMPGTYTLPSLATVFHALYSAGGVNQVGTLRDVVLYRDGKAFKHVDVYGYIMNGDNTFDIVLQDGDLINVGTYEKIVTILGKVKRPMRYELKGDETLSKALEYAGGFTGDAYKKNLNVTRKGDSEYEMYTVYNEEFPEFVMANGDSVLVDAILPRYENRVSVEGAVFRPGKYAISASIATLKDLLDVVEGPREDAFLNRAILYREREDLTREALAIDLGKFMKGEVEDIVLRKNDVLYVPSKTALREGYVIQIRGEVKNPKEYNFVENMTIEDAIIQAGGLLESASEVRVDVSRRIKSPKSTTEAPEEAELFTFALKDGLMVDGIKNFVLEPFDEIYVRRSPGYREQQNVRVDGEILYPGTYAKTSINDRLSDLVARAGGITSKAYLRGARLERRMNQDERMRMASAQKLAKFTEGDSISMESLDLAQTYFVGIDLEKALANPGGEDDLVLREGDVLHVSNFVNTVKISGAVMYPNAVTYKNKMKLRDYIDNAGGYAMNAKKRRAYVIYPNGTLAVRRGGRNPKIEPGCEIIVPMKLERKNRLGLPEILSLTSSTTSIAAMVTSILNSTK